MNVRRNLRVRDISGLIESRLWAQILVAMVVGVGLGLLGRARRVLLDLPRRSPHPALRARLTGHA